MKQLLALIASAILIVSLVVFSFTFQQVNQQHNSLMDDLRFRTILLADSLKESIRPSYSNNEIDALQKVLNKFAGRERLLGLAVYDEKGSLFAASADLQSSLTNDPSIANKAIYLDGVEDDFTASKGSKIYILATPLHEDEKVIGALTIFQRADFISTAISEIWKTNMLRLFLQALLFSLAVVLILRLIIYKPIIRITETVRRVRSGKFDTGFEIKNHGFFKPIAAEISKMTKSLILARNSASAEARMRMEKLDSPWTAERLKEFFKAHLKDRQIFVISNREPYIHKKNKNEIVWTMPPSGMVTALAPVMEACGGTWLAHGSGDADRQTVDDKDSIKVPPDEPKYTLKRIWLTNKEIKGYYVGFSNEALWPLCHLAHTRPIFRKQDWMAYCKVNGKFAQSLLKAIKDVREPIILIQDYHFSLLPRMIKKNRSDAKIGLFWHIPWPNAEIFSICPWRKEILTGLLGADILGFHTQQYCNNFLETVGKEIESLIDLERFTITHSGHTSLIKPFPISVAFTDNDKLDASKSAALERLKIKTDFLGLGVDRLDYTKGILEKFKGIEFFFNTYPAYKEKLTFLQIAAPSREEVEKYKQFSEEVAQEAKRINQGLENNGWKPIILLKESYSHEEIEPLYRAAHVCLVASLSDGMNLVAKEFISAKSDESGVLILSQFTGAARNLGGAIIINPYSAEETAEAIYKAITMPALEQRRRMKKMREAVKNYNIYRWAANFLEAMDNLD